MVDAALEVHRILGPGLLEPVYEQGVSVELGLRAIAFARQVPIAVTYKHVAIGEARLDLLEADQLNVCLLRQGVRPATARWQISLAVLRRILAEH